MTMKDRRKILFFRAAYDQKQVPKSLLALTAVMTLAYLAVIAFGFERGNPILFGLLVAGEIFHVWMVLTYLHTVWETEHVSRQNPRFQPMVDVFITVAGEPAEIVEQTLRGALKMSYPYFEVYLLNDGFVAKKDNWQEIERLAERHNVTCITRKTPGGAKSGNINHALARTRAPFVAIFDADHVPHPDFLKKTMGYFIDPRMGFVQPPQFYRNRDQSYLTAGAWEQQELFFGPILKGKNRVNSVFMCGTNMAVRREALEEVGGMNEENIAEDFFTSAFIHARGWKSVYVPEVLSEGLAPEDFGSYYRQQYRWARGSLELILRRNLLFWRGLSWAQKLQYFASASYYLVGPVVLMNALLPLVFFWSGEVPFRISTMALAAAFLPYIFLLIYVLQKSSNYAYTFRAVAFSMGSWPIQVKAILATLLGLKSSFSVTAKRGQAGNYLYLVLPHLLYILLVALGLGVAVVREGLSSSVINNTAWALFNVALFVPFILAASPKGVRETRKEMPSFRRAESIRT